MIYNPKITYYQNQWQQNYSFAQDFIYGDKASNIIVGSSMAARIKGKFLPSDYFNLSFAGGSVLTGLEIIKATKYIPKYIYIENNIIFNSKDKKILNKLFYPIWWQIKEYIPSLKEKYQPLNLILSKLKDSYGKSHKEHMMDKRNNKIFNMTIKKHIHNYNKKPKRYTKKLEDLNKLIKYFEDKGSTVIFFEMPIDVNLATSIKAREQRSLIKNNLKNAWLPLPDNKKYITSDGIHLLYKSAYEYSKIFLNETKQFKSN